MQYSSVVSERSVGDVVPFAGLIVLHPQPDACTDPFMGGGLEPGWGVVVVGAVVW